MNIYKLTQDENVGYDTYDSAVVIANSEEEARNIHPGFDDDDPDYDDWVDSYDWASTPNNVKVILLGILNDDHFQDNKVICASFNAG